MDIVVQALKLVKSALSLHLYLASHLQKVQVVHRKQSLLPTQRLKLILAVPQLMCGVQLLLLLVVERLLHQFQIKPVLTHHLISLSLELTALSLPQLILARPPSL
jgi:hypothetical protein